MSVAAMIARILAVIGTAGRDKAKPFTAFLWSSMVEDFRPRVRPTDTLVSGGAAWTDHLAVYAYLQGWCAHLILHLPAPFVNSRFVGPAQSAGSIANYYHERFRAVTMVDGLGDLAKAIAKGCTVTYEDAAPGYGAMFTRNKKVALVATAALAYTFGDGKEPVDGGTLNTWKQIVSEDKTHVSLGQLLTPPLQGTPMPTFISMEPIWFCKTHDPYGEFSNFHPTPILGGGKRWPTLEHLYQAQKFLDADLRERIRCLSNPMAAAIEGRNRANPLRSDWEQVKERCMSACLKMKFTQHPTLTDLLMATYPRPIFELSYKDPYWGSKPDGSGQNRLGQLLMQLRDELRERSAFY